MVIVGGIHGDEPRSRDIVAAVAAGEVPAGVRVVAIADANPDGAVAGTRRNARGVDLNRNWDHRWAATPATRGSRRGDGGAAPFSEPESSALAALLRASAPRLAVFVHQPLGYVAACGPATPWPLVTDMARAAGLGTRTVDQQGGAETWVGHRLGPASVLYEAPGAGDAVVVLDRAVAAIRVALAAAASWG